MHFKLLSRPKKKQLKYCLVQVKPFQLMVPPTKKSKSVISQVNLKSCQNKIASAELMPWNPFTRSISWGMHSADASEVTDTLLTDFK